MRPFRKLAVRLAVTVCAAVSAAAAGVLGSSAFDKNTPLLTEYEQPALEETVHVALKGSLIGGADKALKRINELRLEACTQGVWDPRDPSRKLTKSDYVPVKWSYDLEQHARIRAVEASLTQHHLRMNGLGWYSTEYKGLDSGWSETLAWGCSDMVDGINLWASEKSDWVKKNSNAVTGHYTVMINPSVTYVGLGYFRKDSPYGWRDNFCGRWSGSKPSSEKMSASKTDIWFPVQVYTEYLVNGGGEPMTEMKVVSGKTELSKGETVSLEMHGCVCGASVDWAMYYQASWKSSNTSVATVDKYGKVTAKGVGTATVTAECGGLKQTQKITVLPSVADCTVTIPYSSYTYRGRGIKPTVTVKLGSTKLTKGTDYTVSYSNNTNVGTAAITVTGKGKYSGKTTKTFTVKPLDISSSYAKLSIPYKSYTYTGKEITPKVNFTFKDGTAIPAADYKVTYSSNIKVGKAKITLTALSANIRGAWKKTFVVKPAKQTISKITTSKGLFRICWNKDLQASGYQVLYSKDKNFKNDVHSWTTFDLNDTSEGFSRVPQSGETWYVKVRSFTAQNNTRYGNYSAVKSITVK